MSSWIIAKSIPKKIKAPITTYHNTTYYPDIPSMYMGFLAAYIYSQKNGESCSVWDPSGIIKSSFKYNPQVIHIKDNIDTNPPNISAYHSVVSSMKIKEIQKIAKQLLEYSLPFKNEINTVLKKASIRQDFDIGFHIIPGTSLQYYIDILNAYQLKTKKTRLSVYIMTSSYDTITEFQKYTDTTWTIVSLSRNIPMHSNDKFIQNMAEVQIMIKIPTLILNYSQSIDRYIYLMHDNISGINIIKEINSTPWALVI